MTNIEDGLPERGEVAERAYQLWISKGCPDDSAEEDWIEAERELHNAALSRRLLRIADDRSGSVQA